MTYETKITKNFNGYTYKTDCSLGFTPINAEEGGERVLRVETSKKIFSKGIIESWASVHIVRGIGSCKSETHACGMGTDFGDYYKIIHRTPCTRITEKQIAAVHAKAMEGFEAVLMEARAYYNRPKKAAE